METFHKVVIGIALVVLIVLLVVVGVLLNKNKENTVYPPSATKCPDYWMEVEGGCQIGTINKGDPDLLSTVDDNVVNFDDNAKNNYFTKTEKWFNPKNETYTEYSEICAKQAWAMDNKVKWDGIKNYNGCY
jgi:hypothetical protein